MATGCVTAAAFSIGCRSPAAFVLTSSWVSSSQPSLRCSPPPTPTGDNCCSSSDSSGLWVVRGRRTYFSRRQQHYKICTSLAARRPPPSRLDRLCTFSPPSHLAATSGARDTEAVVPTRRSSRLGSSLRLDYGIIGQTRNGLGGQRQQQRRPKAKDDDFEIDDDGGFDTMDLADFAEEEEEDFRDYETEYEAPIGYRPLQRVEVRSSDSLDSGCSGRKRKPAMSESALAEADSFISTEGELEETVVGWRINEEEFHKISMLTCDFFIRKVPDPDNDVYDFREMYVTPPDMDVYSIPKVEGKLPKKPVRCSLSKYEYIHTTEPPVDEPRSPLAKTDYEVMKVFLMKHLRDRRAGHENFILDFEEIYVIDANTKSFSRADVKVEVPGGKNRDRTDEVLTVRDDGTTFCIIPEEAQKSPDEIVQAVHWDETREAMENYLRGFRDYETSNWF